MPYLMILAPLCCEGAETLRLLDICQGVLSVLVKYGLNYEFFDLFYTGQPLGCLKHRVFYQIEANQPPLLCHLLYADKPAIAICVLGAWDGAAKLHVLPLRVFLHLALLF